MQRRLLSGLRGRSAAARSRLDALAARRVFRRPYDRLRDQQRFLDDLQQRAARAVRSVFSLSESRVKGIAAQLESLSPLGVLGRGYTLTHRTTDGRLIDNASELAIGQQLVTQFAAGRAISRVEEIQDQH